MIDPLLWVLAVGKNGNALLRSAFDFKHMSLGTLGVAGIRNLTLDIITPKCFKSDITDTAKLCSIWEMVNRLTIDAVNFFHEKKGEVVFQLENFNVCLEKQSGDRRYVVTDTSRTETLLSRLSESGHGVLQLTSEYFCLQVDYMSKIPTIIHTIKLSDHAFWWAPWSPIIPRDRAYWWIPWLLNAVVTLVIMFSPYLFFAFFDWENPPKNGKIRLDTRPYPFGFFHFVFYSNFVKSRCAYNLFSLSCWLRHIFFFFFYLSLLFTVYTLPVC